MLLPGTPSPGPVCPPLGGMAEREGEALPELFWALEGAWNRKERVGTSGRSPAARTPSPSPASRTTAWGSGATAWPGQPQGPGIPCPTRRHPGESSSRGSVGREAGAWAGGPGDSRPDAAPQGHAWFSDERYHSGSPSGDGVWGHSLLPMDPEGLATCTGIPAQQGGAGGRSRCRKPGGSECRLRPRTPGLASQASGFPPALPARGPPGGHLPGGLQREEGGLREEGGCCRRRGAAAGVLLSTPGACWPHRASTASPPGGTIYTQHQPSGWAGRRAGAGHSPF